MTNRFIKNRFLLPALMAGLGFLLAGRVMAQAFTNLYSFTADTSGYNSDGADPFAGLILANNILYGTTENGGTNGAGTVFSVNTDGTNFTTLHDFAGINTRFPEQAGLILSVGTLYGVTSGGGLNGEGAVFAVSTNGCGFTNLYSFTALTSITNWDGANPTAGLILSGSTLYGTAADGGTNNQGTIFAISTNGETFTTLHSFSAAGYNSSGQDTNSDGANPVAGLVLEGNTLYGTAYVGGTNGQGTVFAISGYNRRFYRAVIP